MARLSLILKHRTISLPETYLDSLQTISIDVAEALMQNGERSNQSGSAILEFEAESDSALVAYAQVVNPIKGLMLNPVGKFEGSTIVAATNTTAINNWINGSTKNPLPSGLQPVTQQISVFVDNFRLQPDPAITNRTLTFSGSGTTSPPVTFTITWPN